MYSVNRHNARMARFITVTLLLLFMLAIALPAWATPPEELNFTFSDVTYYDLPTDRGYGDWSANGLFASAGTLVEDPNHSGWDPDGCWRTVHTEGTLVDAATGDTISIRTQVTKIDGAPYCTSFTAKVNWVIVGGTGAYAELHGQGSGSASGYLEFVDPQTVNYVLTFNLEGQGHFD